MLAHKVPAWGFRKSSKLPEEQAGWFAEILLWGAMTGNAPNWALPELFCVSEEDFDGPDFSKLILVVLRRLDAEFPNRTDLTACKRIAANQDNFNKLWFWLSEQWIVSGTPANCSLTLSGKVSFSTALERLPSLAAELLSKEAGLEGEKATKMLLTVMRHHFETFNKASRQT